MAPTPSSWGNDTLAEGPTREATSGRGSDPNLQHGGTTSEHPSPFFPQLPYTMQLPQTIRPPPHAPRSNLLIALALWPPPTISSFGPLPHEWPRWPTIVLPAQPTRPNPTEGDVMGREGVHTGLPPPGQPSILPSPTSLASQPPLPSQPGMENQNQVGRRRKNKGKGGKRPGPTPTGQPPNSHSPLVPAPLQGHGSEPAHSPPGRLSLPLNPPPRWRLQRALPGWRPMVLLIKSPSRSSSAPTLPVPQVQIQAYTGATHAAPPLNSPPPTYKGKGSKRPGHLLPLPSLPLQAPLLTHISFNLHQALPLQANHRTHTPLPCPPLYRAMGANQPTHPWAASPFL
ncbi:unnamed protein product [Closterium sp. Naga37s-1]|nr:unnamed protein product [Closterium sp. Naga37s-1]